ncbi:MAG: PA14 domain-containing protein [Polyangiaceae bacterium]
MRPLALVVPSIALAATFALTGCTIYTYSTPPPKNRKPGKTATTTTGTKPTRGPIVMGRPGSKRDPGSSGGGTFDEAPTIKGETIFGSGTRAAFRGNAYVIPEGTKTMPNFRDLVPFATLYTDKFNVSPQVFSGGFPGALQQDEWFAIQYLGAIVLPASGNVTFKLVSDDGAILYIDDKKVIDNDGVHTAKTVTAQASLEAGRHEVRLEYFQEQQGSVALQLFTVVGGQDVPVVGLR